MLMVEYSLKSIRPIIERLAIALWLMLLELIDCCRCLAGFSTRIPTDLNGGRREDLERSRTGDVRLNVTCTVEKHARERPRLVFSAANRVPVAPLESLAA
jgi:hypothetical protein